MAFGPWRLASSLQDGLGTINTERVRFQRACEDIELHHQDELQELKQHLAMALTSFQELQRASEHRESEMREALKGATDRSSKFEAEKDALMQTMSDSRMNGAAAQKEAEMLKEAITKLQGEYEKKVAEYEDARKRFSQVKEALTVERNLRARAEIKEEQMRQEIIATTGQMHAMRDKFVGDIEVTSKEVEDKTEELTAKVTELTEELKVTSEELTQKTTELTVLQGEVGGLKSALSGASAKAAELSELAEKAGMVDGLKREILLLQKAKEESEGASKEELETLKALCKEQEDKLLAADDERRKMHNIIQELRGNIRVYIRVRPFLSSDKGVDLEGKSSHFSCETSPPSSPPPPPPMPVAFAVARLVGVAVVVEVVVVTDPPPSAHVGPLPVHRQARPRCARQAGRRRLRDQQA